jgi:acetylornithine deacetylase/succinyl-diaminopimelate desuccinylase-like protein
VGRAAIFPNAVNVIPGLVRISVDIRSIDMKSKEIMIDALNKEVKRIETERQVRIRMDLENNDIPLECDRHIIGLLDECREALNIPGIETISGPYHDSLFIGKFAPTAMLFVPSKNGISHSKDEWTSYEDIALGTDILAGALLKLANE